MKVLHILYQSLPTKVGSTIRSRDILMSQYEIGIDAFALSSPFQEPVSFGKEMEVMDGIKYYRFSRVNEKEKIDEKAKSIFLQLKKLWKLFYFNSYVKRIALVTKPDIIHAHSTFFTGIAGFQAAKLLKVPFVYEVRSLWEEHRSVVKRSIKNKILTWLIRKLENYTIRKADFVVVLNRELEKNLISRGFNPDKFTVIPNAVNLSLIPIEKLQKKKDDKITFGYIGSIITIEGLGLLIESLSELKLKDVDLLIYGRGAQREELESKAAKMNMCNVIFMGEIDSNEVYKAYNNIDVIVNPRINNIITKDVTPLKPLEAMAYRKLVVASNVNGMKEIISDGSTGLLFESDNKEDLKRIICEIYENGIDSYTPIIERAYDYVKNEKAWIINANKYNEIYTKLILTNTKKL